jgi:hypothetical protein
MIVDSSLSLTSSVAFALSSPPDYRECRLFKNCIGQGECGWVHICTLHRSQAHQVVSCRQFVGVTTTHEDMYMYFVLEVPAGVDDPKEFENMAGATNETRRKVAIPICLNCHQSIMTTAGSRPDSRYEALALEACSSGGFCMSVSNSPMSAWVALYQV